MQPRIHKVAAWDTHCCSLGYALLPLRRRDGAKEGFGLRVASGALAGCTAWSTIYPIDVLRLEP